MYKTQAKPEKTRNYTCQVFTDQADHRMLEKLYREYIPNDASGLPSFVIGMDRLVSNFRARFRPDRLEDGDMRNLQEDNLEEEQQTGENEDDDEYLPMDGESGDPNEDQDFEEDFEEVESNYFAAASGRFGDTSNPQEDQPFYSVEASHSLDGESEETLKEILRKYHTNTTRITADVRENTILITTAVANMTSKKIKSLEGEFKQVYPHMEDLRVGTARGRLAFKLQL